MDRDGKNPREQTNDSLRAERQRSDDELLERSDALAEDAEALIMKARERANRVLHLARDREDTHLASAGATSTMFGVVQQGRRTEDTVLESERAEADAERLGERERRRLAMLQLLALERQATDRTLDTERKLTDRSVSAHVDMLGVVAHDLRNLLNILVINAASIVMSRDHASTVPLAQMIQKAGGQMNVLLEDLLDFSSMEAGELLLRRVSTDVVLLVRDVIAIHGPAATANDIELTFTCAHDSLVVEADPRRLSRVVINLLANAFKFTPSHGRVAVELTRLDDSVEIAVSDSGPGIAESDLESIFERYRQGHPTQRSTGVGLGLFIARAVVIAHGGTIRVENRRDGGAVFRTRVPLRAPAKNS